MPSRLFDPDYWRERAEEARAQAEQMSDPATKRSLLAIAENYEQIAEQQQALIFSASKAD